MGMTSSLRVAGVGFAYAGSPAPALVDVSLELSSGDGVALLGGNGAGKTTLLRLAMALLHPGSGTIEVQGRDIGPLRPEDVARHAGYLFQQPESQLFARTVRDEVSFGLRQFGATPDSVAPAVDAVLAETRLSDVADVHPYDLAAPQRRLVALAAVLAADPVLLLLDEPTAGLDRGARMLVRDVVLARRARGAAVLAVTHDGEFALEALSRGVVLRDGRVRADGPIEATLGSADAVPPLPAPAVVARRLGLAPASLRLAAVAAALADRCRSRPQALILGESGSPPPAS